MTKNIFDGTYFQAIALDQGIVEIRIDRKDAAVNTLDTHATQELSCLLDRIGAEALISGVLLTSGKTAFLAGADIKVLAELMDQSQDDLVGFSRDSGAVLTRLEDLPVPVVAAINGYALGGGFETALCSDYRVLASNGQVGFPEAGLGILPGFGGTVRMARLADTATTLEWLVGARPHGAEKALEAGVVDAIAPEGSLRSVALDWLQQASSGALDWRARRQRRGQGFVLDHAALLRAQPDAQAKAAHYPAGQVIIELIKKCAPLSRDAALQEEAQAFARLAKTPTAKSLVQIFLANQQIKKKSLQHAGRGKAIKRVAVLGAGIMGGGIAYSSAVKGMPVLLKDIAQGALDLGIGEARKLLGKQIESGRMKQGQADAILSSITPLLEFEQFDQVEIAVEAVVESLAVKQQVISQVESLVRPGTVIVSNTSSLAIADIAAPLQRPQDVAGMHFFNPVHLMPLVEVVRGPRTSEETVAGVVAYALAMGKTPLVVKDCPGFLINRILGAYFTAFLLLIRDGAGFEQVDRAMEAWGWPMGPAYLLDVAGLDTLDKALLILGKAYPEVMATPFKTAINILAAEKRYGQKTGAGFYRYERTPGGKPRRSADPAAYDLLRQGQPQGTRTFEDQDIVNRMMLAMILEADRCLHEAVAEGPLEIDAGMRMGTGFPAHAGGPLWHADQIGLEVVAARAQALRPLGGLYQPSPGLLSRVGQKLSYYGAQGEPTPAAV